MPLVTSNQIVRLRCDGGVHDGKTFIIQADDDGALVSPIDGYAVTFTRCASSARGREYSDDVRLVPTECR